MLCRPPSWSASAPRGRLTAPAGAHGAMGRDGRGPLGGDHPRVHTRGKGRRGERGGSVRTTGCGCPHPPAIGNVEREEKRKGVRPPPPTEPHRPAVAAVAANVPADAGCPHRWPPPREPAWYTSEPTRRAPPSRSWCIPSWPRQTTLPPPSQTCNVRPSPRRSRPPNCRRRVRAPPGRRCRRHHRRRHRRHRRQRRRHCHPPARYPVCPPVPPWSSSSATPAARRRAWTAPLPASPHPPPPLARPPSATQHKHPASSPAAAAPTTTATVVNVARIGEGGERGGPGGAAIPREPSGANGDPRDRNAVGGAGIADTRACARVGLETRAVGGQKELAGRGGGEGDDGRRGN